jgi:ribosomal protein L11 methylase PrmA
MDRVLVAQTTVANLLAPLLISWAARLKEAAELPRQLVVGGLLPTERSEVARAFAAHGFRELEHLSSADWSALLLASDT